MVKVKAEHLSIKGKHLIIYGCIPVFP